jgi:hypothetical protein
VPVFEVGCVNGEYFLAMEYVEGCDLGLLARRLREAGRLCPVPLALFIAHEISRGLDHAHRQVDAAGAPLQIVHRDVSPQNILLGRDGTVRLADFGIAKAMGKSQRTRTGNLVGKFAYMSPEQAMGYALDARCDVFALGVVLHELLTGKPLFDGETDPEVLRKVQEARVLPPSLYREDLPTGLDALVLRALARNPGQRFSTMAELGRELARMLYAGTPSGAVELAALLAELRPVRSVTSPRLEAPALEALPEPARHTATMAPPDDAPAPEQLAFPRRRRLQWVAGALAAAAVVLGIAAPWRAPAVPPSSPPPLEAAREPLVALPPVKAHPPAPVRAPAGAGDKVGNLVLRVTPASRISIDGRTVSPASALLKQSLEAGPHEVLVRNDLLGREESFDVDLEPGATVHRHLDLTASAAPAPSGALR